jgi:hypothetical protein
LAYWKEQNYSFTESDIMLSSRCVPKLAGTAACIVRVDGDRLGFVEGSVGISQTTEPFVQMDGNILLGELQI